MSAPKIVSKQYSLSPTAGRDRNKTKMPLVKVQISIFNPRSGKITSFEERCRIDTGFDSDLFIQGFHDSDAKLIGVNPSTTNVRLGDGTVVPSGLCLGYITRIEDCMLPRPGIEVQLFMRGDPPYGFLGLGVLKNWIATFDGPKQCFDIC